MDAKTLFTARHECLKSEAEARRKARTALLSRDVAESVGWTAKARKLTETREGLERELIEMGYGAEVDWAAND
jgi:hypothetical protein